MSDEGTWADESDWELGAEEVAEAIEEAAAPPPVVAVVGRPNVGSWAAVRRWCRMCRA
jgi:GTPase